MGSVVERQARRGRPRRLTPQTTPYRTYQARWCVLLSRRAHHKVLASTPGTRRPDPVRGSRPEGTSMSAVLTSAAKSTTPANVPDNTFVPEHAPAAAPGDGV